MNGVHDLGGMHGFGPVELHDAGLRFESDWWEAAAVAMQSAMEGSVTNIDEFRHAIERMDPVHYLGSTYFEHWVESIVSGCVEHGVFAEEELEARESAARDGRTLPTGLAANPWPRRRDGHPFRRRTDTLPRFAAGDAVRTKNMQPQGHTRLARYARGKRGIVAEYRGCFVFPDTHAHGLGESPQHLYSVRFANEELWGDAAEPGTHVYIDLFGPYLDLEA